MVATSTISLDTAISNDGKELTLYDTVPSRELQIDPIIEARYLNDMSQQEVADIFGMSQVQVSRQEKKIKEKIKVNLAA